MDFSVSLHFCGAHDHLPAGHVHGPGITDCYCIQFCTKGCGVFIVDGARFPLKAGECIVNFPGQTKTEIADAKTPWNLSWISFSGESVDACFKHSSVSKTNPSFSWHSHKYLLDLLSEIIQIFDSSEEKSFIFSKI